MQVQFNEIKLIALFIDVDDLLKSYQAYQQSRQVGQARRPTRVPELSESEVCTILAAYHLSGYKCFEYYYRQVIQESYQSYFPQAPSYERFLTLVSRCYKLMWLWSLHCCLKAHRTGLYIIDSKRLEVCHLKREHSHRVFSAAARKGKTSTGWFYGFKVHLVINDRGEIVNWTITPGNVADNNPALLQQLLRGLTGICLADKGYYTRLFEWFYQHKLHLVLKPKKNMKKDFPCLIDQQHYLRKRALIESVNDLLVSVCDLEHTRHRKPENAFAHIAAALIAYQFLDHKPAIFIPNQSEKYNMAA
jgi:Transposase DDE domain